MSNMRSLNKELDSRLLQGLQAHNWEEADKLYETVLPVIPENANAWALYGLLKFQQGSKPKAKKLFIKALSVQKDQPIALSFFSQLDSGDDLEEYCPNKITEEFLPKHDLFEINNLSSEMARKVNF